MLNLFSKHRQTDAVAATEYRIKPLASGLSLVELLVTIAVLALGMVGVFALQSQTMQAGSLATGRNMATSLVESQSEWLRTMDINRVEFVSQEPEKLTASGKLCADAPTEPCIFTRTVTITKGAPTTTSYAVSIKVQWQNKQVVYDTVVAGVGFF